MYVRKLNSRGIHRMMSNSAQQNALIQQVTQQQQERTARVVPWFLQNMPVRLTLNMRILKCISVLIGAVTCIIIGFLLQLHPGGHPDPAYSGDRYHQGDHLC